MDALVKACSAINALYGEYGYGRNQYLAGVRLGLRLYSLFSDTSKKAHIQCALF